MNVADLLRSLAQHLHDKGVATYLPAGGYSVVTTPAVFFGELKEEPDLAVSLIVYSIDPELDGFGTDLQSSNPLVRVQLNWRAAGSSYLAAETLAQQGFEAIHSQTPGTWPGGVAPLWCLRTVVAPAMQDSNQRWMRADSYEIRFNPGE